MKHKQKQLLNLQADLIEAVLREYRVNVQVRNVFVAPRWVRFQVLPLAGVTVKSIRARTDELRLALQTKAVRVTQSQHGLAVEMQRLDPHSVTFASLFHKHLEERQFCTCIAGLQADGTILMIRFWASDVAHILITGTTGAGKSALMRTMSVDLASNNAPDTLQFVMIDVKNRPLQPFKDLPHLITPVITDPARATAVLEQLVALMEERDRQGLSITEGDGGEPRIMVVIDELTDLCMVGGEAVKHSIVRLAQRGREAGIHLLAGTQKPSATVLSGLALANFPLRIVGKVPTTQEAAFASGISGSGAESLSGLGDMIAIQGGNTVPFQAAYISTRDLLKVVAEINKEWPSVTLVSLPTTIAEDGRPAEDAQLAAYVEEVRPIWDELQENGQVRRGGKADIAEIIFGERDTAGHKGKWVSRVIEQLQNDGIGGGGGEPEWPREPEQVFELKLKIARIPPSTKHEGVKGNTGGMAWRIEKVSGSSQDLVLPQSWVARSLPTFRRLFAFLEVE